MINRSQCGLGTTRVAIVTGGSRCIGSEVARKLAGQGYAVVINYAANQADADAAVGRILEANGVALAVRADVADELDVERLFDETSHAFGGIDVVVHAAARMILGPLADYASDALDAMQRTSLRGTLMINQQAARKVRDGGAIVNFSASAVALTVSADAAYAASKGAVESVTRALARELCQRDVTVNAVAIGPDTPGSAANIANLVAFLAGQDGHSINGQVIRPSGEIA